MTTLALSSYYSKYFEFKKLIIVNCNCRDNVRSYASGQGAGGVIASVVYAALKEPLLVHLSTKTAILLMLCIPLAQALT
jgi:tRNA C32,U32 (ribose-2'-O)-methylase TrmJ